MKRAAILYFAADFISLVGNSAIGLALPWLVLLRTGDAAAAGLVAAATAVPAFIAAQMLGALIALALMGWLLRDDTAIIRETRT